MTLPTNPREARLFGAVFVAMFGLCHVLHLIERRLIHNLMHAQIVHALQEAGQ